MQCASDVICDLVFIIRAFCCGFKKIEADGRGKTSSFGLQFNKVCKDFLLAYSFDPYCVLFVFIIIPLSFMFR